MQEVRRVHRRRQVSTLDKNYALMMSSCWRLILSEALPCFSRIRLWKLRFCQATNSTQCNSPMDFTPHGFFAFILLLRRSPSAFMTCACLLACEKNILHELSMMLQSFRWKSLPSLMCRLRHGLTISATQHILAPRCYERLLVPLLAKSSRQKGMQNTQH